MTRPRLANIRFAPASPPFIEKGCLGWICVEYGDLQLDGLRVRRHDDGRLSIGFPQRVDAQGFAHAFVRPLDREARAYIEGAVLSDLHRRGKIVWTRPKSHSSENRTEGRP